MRGVAEPVTHAEADAYFATRARQSQVGAWASDQSRTLDGRSALESRMIDAARCFDGQAVARPPHWSGWLLRPAAIEFWSDRPFRLHDRALFERAGGVWAGRRLFP